jgi:hypothetical protein
MEVHLGLTYVYYFKYHYINIYIQKQLAVKLEADIHAAFASKGIPLESTPGYFFGGNSNKMLVRSVTQKDIVEAESIVNNALNNPTKPEEVLLI